ncbi:MAG: crossover junction endodeoxyribonuclease RuvC [candidate division Zixibacteria bacterium]|nr:crossover junction endodeoxyribonuclease RuvC [candidate division Zixibacteria bacterium]
MRVLGIDPGLLITGYGVLEVGGETPRLVEAGVIRTTERNSVAERLGEISRGLEEIIREFQPEAMAIEELYSHYSHPATAIIMGHARGVVLLKAAENGLAVFPYASTRIKKSLLGNGRASKGQVQMMIRSTLGLKAVPEPPDAADALAAALCHCRAMDHHVESAGTR